jgi:hypothetical protein
MHTLWCPVEDLGHGTVSSVAHAGDNVVEAGPEWSACMQCGHVTASCQTYKVATQKMIAASNCQNACACVSLRNGHLPK